MYIINFGELVQHHKTFEKVEKFRAQGTDESTLG